MYKLWIDLEGIVHPVQDCHEEWATHHGQELESMLAQGWVRVQNVPPQYLYLDYHCSLTAAQAKAVRVLFENRFDKVVVEFRGDIREFGNNEAALAHALQSETTDQAE